MRTTKVFQSGNSPAVRIPSEFRFEVPEVEIERRREELVLRRPAQDLTAAFEALVDMPEDWFAEPREDLPPTQSGSERLFHDSGSMQIEGANVGFGARLGSERGKHGQ